MHKINPHPPISIAREANWVIDTATAAERPLSNTIRHKKRITAVFHIKAIEFYFYKVSERKIENGIKVPTLQI